MLVPKIAYKNLRNPHQEKITKIYVLIQWFYHVYIERLSLLPQGGVLVILDIKGIGNLTIVHWLCLGLFAKHRKGLSKTWAHFQLCQSHHNLETKSSSLPKIPIQNLLFNTLDYKFDFHFQKTWWWFTCIFGLSSTYYKTLDFHWGLFVVGT